MRVVFMGTTDFAVGTLEAIIEAGHEVVGVVTQPDKPKGRGKTMQYTPVKEVALAHEIPVFQPVKVKEESAVEKIRAWKPDVMVVVAFGQILSKELLDLPKYGCINVHASLLPKYRGSAPIQWAIIDGEPESGVTTMQMDEGVDTGDMLEQVVVPLSADETGGSLFGKLAQEGAKLLVHTLEQVEAGSLQPVKQEHTKATHAKMLDKQLGNIDFSKPAVEIERLIRGLNPWPSAYTKLQGKTLKIWKAAVVESESKGACGTIVSVTKHDLFVQTGEGLLQLQEVQLEGKKRMDIDAFLRGITVEKGTVLG